MKVQVHVHVARMFVAKLWKVEMGIGLQTSFYPECSRWFLVTPITL